MEDITEILLTAIATERYGHEYYIRLSQAIANEEGKAIMIGLARDEKEHEELLAKEYMRVSDKLVPEKIELSTAIGAEAVEKIFSGGEKTWVEAEDVLEALEFGIAIEQKSIDFYSSKGSTTEDEKLRQLFADLVKIEKEHKSLLEENLFHLKQNGSWWGYVPILEG